MVHSSDNQETADNGDMTAIDGAQRDLRNNIWPAAMSLWMTAFYLALVIIRPWERLFPWMDDFFPFQKTFALLMLVVILFSTRTRLQLSFQSVTVIFFTIALALSSILAREPALAWEPYYDYLTVVFIYFVLMAVIRSPYDLAFMGLCFIGIMSMYLSKSLWEFFLHGNLQYRMGVVRLVGIEHMYGSPNGLAASVVHSLPILFFLWVTRHRISASWPAFYRRLLPKFLLFYTVIAIMSIILTNSRAGFVSLLLFLGLIFLRVRSIPRKVGFLIIALLVCLVVWVAMPDENKKRFTTIWNPDAGPHSAEVSAMGRIAGFKAGIQTFQKFPITGVGLGGFSEYRKEFIDGSSERAHSLAGQLLGVTGILGTSTFTLMILTALAGSRRTRKLSENSDDPTMQTLHAMSEATRMMIILLLFQGLFSHNMLRFNWLMAAAFAALSLQFVRQLHEDKGRDAGTGNPDTRLERS